MVSPVSQRHNYNHSMDSVRSPPTPDGNVKHGLPARYKYDDEGDISDNAVYDEDEKKNAGRRPKLNALGSRSFVVDGVSPVSKLKNTSGDNEKKHNEFGFKDIPPPPIPPVSVNDNDMNNDALPSGNTTPKAKRQRKMMRKQRDSLIPNKMTPIGLLVDEPKEEEDEIPSPPPPPEGNNDPQRMQNRTVGY